MSRAKIAPVSWHPARATERARQKESRVPLPELRLVDVGGEGPEDVLVGGDGSVWTGTADGAVRRISFADDGSPRVEVVAKTGGRPLGLEWLPDGRLLVCDAERGLLAVDPRDGAVVVLTAEVAQKPLTLCNNAAVAGDGRVWFTDSSDHHGLTDWRAEIFEHSGTGRLLCREASGDGVALVAAHLEFANGVALAPDGSAVFFAETGSYRISKVWLTGPSAGIQEVVLDNLPGFPDNISTGTDGLIWIGMAGARERLVDALAPAPPWVRKLAWATPEFLQPQAKPIAWVMAFDPADGRVVHDLQASRPGFGMSTGVREWNGTVWLGSLTGTTIASFRLPR
ncbi:SMP-30/gluconolactonase/LRE family protein [Spongisporangium articulatum]|uniref:SMP-30/gluconolactonase/LRE family protein n=1 Tax=Spongisporangium articulatum TaxID=3362603 RepID=A0ABW8AH73_9ACTN